MKEEKNKKQTAEKSAGNATLETAIKSAGIPAEFPKETLK